MVYTGVAISTGMALHLVGFTWLTFTHCALAVGI